MNQDILILDLYLGHVMKQHSRFHKIEWFSKGASGTAVVLRLFWGGGVCRLILAPPCVLQSLLKGKFWVFGCRQSWEQGDISPDWMELWDFPSDLSVCLVLPGSGPVTLSQLSLAWIRTERNKGLSPNLVHTEREEKVWLKNSRNSQKTDINFRIVHYSYSLH